jgi:DNA-directed RNA polymerase specialized sigma24 family protein
MALGGKGALAKPLTRSTKAGKPYARPPEVEAQLSELLRRSADEQLARAKVMDRSAPQYVKDECLVYQIRDAWLADDAERYSTLMAQLLRRCTRSIQRNLRALGVATGDVKDVYVSVIESMMAAILADDGSGDFYQVRFRRGLRFQILRVHARYARRQQRAQLEDSLNAPSGRGEEGEEYGDALEERVGGPEDVAGDAERRLVIREAVAAIRDSRHRKAFVLHYYDDWPIEAKDPLEPSISRHFDVSPRTVNNWLRAAERDLAEWRAAKSA